MRISPPKHLSAKARSWFTGLQREYGVSDAAGLALLTAAAESWQRAAEARELIAKEGAVLRDRFGQSVPHPAVRIETAARAQLLQAIRQLGFDLAPVKPVGRPSAASYPGR